MGLRSVTLGHGFAPVVEAVTRTIVDGVNFSRPTVLEAQAAEEARLTDEGVRGVPADQR